MLDIWFHRYRDGVDIEGRFDYNSWTESDKARRLQASLDKDVVLAEGYKEYDTGRDYMARKGDWRNNKDEEINLDGIGGVNILVKADVHRSGMFPNIDQLSLTDNLKALTSLAMRLRIKQKLRDSRRWQNVQAIRLWAYQITSFGLVGSSLLF